MTHPAPLPCPVCGQPSLIEALRAALVALNTARRFLVPSLRTDSYRIAAQCDAALAAVTEG